MPISPHHEFITALTEFYTVLHDLAVVDCLHLPAPESGLHSPDLIISEAARAAGYQEDAISLMYAMPYLDVGLDGTDDVELLPNAFATTYLGADLGQLDFKYERTMHNDELMPSTALRLTRSERGYGEVLIYDTETKLMTRWQPANNADEVDDYSHVPAKSPREALGPIINDYRRLHYLATPNGIDHNDDFFAKSEGKSPSEPHWTEAQRQIWKRDYDIWAATRKLKDICLECGWAVNEVEQSGFRRDEYVEKRAVYWNEVVEPIIRIEVRLE